MSEIQKKRQNFRIQIRRGQIQQLKKEIRAELLYKEIQARNRLCLDHYFYHIKMPELIIDGVLKQFLECSQDSFLDFSMAVVCLLDQKHQMFENCFKIPGTANLIMLLYRNLPSDYRKTLVKPNYVRCLVDCLFQMESCGQMGGGQVFQTALELMKIAAKQSDYFQFQISLIQIQKLLVRAHKNSGKITDQLLCVCILSIQRGTFPNFWILKMHEIAQRVNNQQKFQNWEELLTILIGIHFPYPWLLKNIVYDSINRYSSEFFSFIIQFIERHLEDQNNFLNFNDLNQFIRSAPSQFTSTQDSECFFGIFYTLIYQKVYHDSLNISPILDGLFRQDISKFLNKKNIHMATKMILLFKYVDDDELRQQQKEDLRNFTNECIKFCYLHNIETDSLITYMHLKGDAQYIPEANKQNQQIYFEHLQENLRNAIHNC